MDDDTQATWLRLSLWQLLGAMIVVGLLCRMIFVPRGPGPYVGTSYRYMHDIRSNAADVMERIGPWLILLFVLKWSQWILKRCEVGEETEHATDELMRFRLRQRNDEP